MDDPRPDELLEEYGRIASRLRLSLAWSDGLEGAAAKACSRGGADAWKKAKPISENEKAAAGFFKTHARKRNPAVPAGASNLFLVEVDLNVPDIAAPPQEEIAARVDALLVRLGIALPETVTVCSRRGLHFYYRLPAGCAPVKVQIGEASGIAPSRDGYLVGAGALHELPGVVYRYVSDGEIAVVPRETYELLVERGELTRERVWAEFKAGEPIAEGFRNETLFHAALELGRAGKPRAELWERLMEINREQCSPPLAADLIRKQINGALKFARRNPTETERARAEARRVLDQRHRVGPVGSSKPPDAGWEEPVPLPARSPVPSFPLDALPDWLRSWAVETAQEKAASVDLAATLALGVVAGALARHVQVSPRPGWWEPINLYLAVALEPGQRKSPVFKAAFRPVRTLERKRINEWGERAKLISLSRAIYDKRRRELIDEATDDEELDPEQLRERMDARLGGLDEPEEAPRPRLLTEDVTPEALAGLLADHGRIIAASDEGAAIFENFSGRYTRGSTSWDVFNKAHSAADLVVDRKSSGPVIVWDPALTLVIATQPKTLSDLWGKPGAVGRGVLARPLYALPGPAYLSGRTPPVSAATLAGFETRVRNLFEDVPLLALDEEERPQPVTLQLDPAAEAEFERFEEELSLERRALGTSDEAEDQAAYLGWISKLAGQTARLAACLHAAVHWTSGATSNTTIESASITAAIALARYFREHAQVVFGLMGELPEQRRAETILGWLQQRSAEELERLTVRDLHRSRGKGTTAEQVKAALGLLEQHGYVRIERARVGDAKRGPMPERLLVHPALREAESGSTHPTDPTSFAPEPSKPAEPVGSVGSVEHDPGPPAAAAPGRDWLARDGVWRSYENDPPALPGEVLEERDA